FLTTSASSCLHISFGWAVACAGLKLLQVPVHLPAMSGGPCGPLPRCPRASAVQAAPATITARHHPILVVTRLVMCPSPLAKETLRHFSNGWRLLTAAPPPRNSK